MFLFLIMQFAIFTSHHKKCEIICSLWVSCLIRRKFGQISTISILCTMLGLLKRIFRKIRIFKIQIYKSKLLPRIDNVYGDIKIMSFNVLCAILLPEWTTEHQTFLIFQRNLSFYYMQLLIFLPLDAKWAILGGKPL